MSGATLRSPPGRRALDRRDSAERSLALIATHMALQTVRDDDFEMWRQMLARILADLTDVAPELRLVRRAAEVVAYAAPGRDLEAGLTRLRFEVATYVALAATVAFETWEARR